ncbi:MAG: site-specific integrase [Oscillibacter sp.]|nr:site-specific integrase [Oscillibacter sp.]
MATYTKRGSSYLIRASAGYTVDGKQVRPSMTWKPEPGMTEKQIERELNRQMVLFDEKCRGAVQGDGHIKFQTFSEMWMREYVEVKLAVRTQESYRNMLVRVNKSIGHLYVDRITTRTIQDFMTSLREPEANLTHPGKELSPRTLRCYRNMISAIFKYAVRMEMIERNPCANVILPPLPRAKEKQCFTMDEAQKFLDALTDAPLMWQCFFTLALFGGYRREELLGLEFQDFDFDACTVSVSRASVYTRRTGIVTVPPKTVRSSRVLKLPAWIFNLVRRLQTEKIEQRLKYGDQWHECGRLFTKADGSPLNPHAPYNWLKNFSQQKNLPFYGIHQFRHLNASLLIFNGENVRTVASMLGHSTPAVTLDVYGHTFETA